MIVCICHRVSDRDIKTAVRAGITNFDVLQDELAVASSCGCCHDCARAVFDAACAAGGCSGGAAGVGSTAMRPPARVVEIHPAAVG